MTTNELFGWPAILFISGPLVLLGLLLLGPVVLVLTIVAALAACAFLVTLAAAIVAAPYLFVRHLRRRGHARPPRGVPAAAPLVRAGSRQAAA